MLKNNKEILSVMFDLDGTLADLDNQSLTAVWSSGECVNIKT